MNNEEKKTCLDCLHCKVAANVWKKGRWCFCALSKNKPKYIEKYWQIKKKVCKMFDDMSEPIRRPLLRERA